MNFYRNRADFGWDQPRDFRDRVRQGNRHEDRRHHERNRATNPTGWDRPPEPPPYRNVTNPLFASQYPPINPSNDVSVIEPQEEPVLRQTTEHQGWKGYEMPEPDPKEGKKTMKQKVRKKASNFAELSTVAGLIWIKNSSTWRSRLFWIMAVCAMLAVLIWHLTYITVRYRKYDITTKFSTKSEVLNFPSVTICNLNAIRASKIENGSALSTLIDNVGAVFQYEISFQDPANMSSEVFEYDYGGNYDFFDDSHFNLYDELYDSADYEEGGVFTGSIDESVLADNQYKSLIGELPLENRSEMGHQIGLMIQKCTFNGRTCYPANFTHTFSGDYGNCYTWNSATVGIPSYTTRFVGPSHGLSLQLFKEDLEYISGFTQGGGFRLAIHPFGTLPHPYDLGYSIAAGSETFVGLRLKNFTRVGKPFSDCDDGAAFRAIFNATYTKKTCEVVCADVLIAGDCGCYVGERVENYPPGTTTSLPACHTTSDRKQCADNLEVAVAGGSRSCGCIRACRGHEYVRQISSNSWPDYGMYNFLVSSFCGNDREGFQCDHLVERADEPVEELDWLLRNNFAKVNVYYNNLNYDNIEEEPEYPLSAFAADIGGTIGLWLGLSVFSVIELMMLAAALLKVLALKSGLTNSGPQEQHQQQQIQNTQDTDPNFGMARARSWLVPPRHQNAEWFDPTRF